ncbi:MAG: hypothetical protein ACPGU1_23135 [Myxococcota bacterium]
MTTKHRMTRRQALQMGSAAALWVACSGGPKGAAQDAGPDAAQDVATVPDTAAPRDRTGAQSLLEWIFETPAEDLVAVAVERLNGGLAYSDLIAGMLAATVTPAPLEMHRRAGIFSAHQLGRELAPRNDLPLMYALLRLKSELGPFTAVDPIAVVGAPGPAELTAALESWDASASANAVAALVQSGQLIAAQDILFEFGARNYNWIGHTTIDVVQTLRTLAFSGWFEPEAALTALTDKLCNSDTKVVDAFERNQELALGLPEDWAAGTPDEGAALELLAGLRSATPQDAVNAAIGQLQSGVAPASLWEACRLAAAELTLRFPFEGWIKFPMHAVTTNNALRHAFDTTSSDRLQRLLLLQAVAFLPQNRDMCLGHNGENPDTSWHLDAMTPAPDIEPSLDDVFEALSTSRSDAISVALAHLDQGGDPQAFIARFRDSAYPTLLEEHQVKHPVAAFEEAGLAAPTWRNRLLAAAFHYGVEPTHKPWTSHDAVVAALTDLTV